MPTVPENFMMQRRINGLNVYQPAADLPPGDVSDIQNLYSYDGELYSRWGKQACFVSPPSNNPNYGMTEFIRTDGTTVIVFCNNGKLYYSTVGTPPLTYAEIRIGGVTSFSLTSAKVQMKKGGKYLYLIDGTGPLYRININADGTYTAVVCTALTPPGSATAKLTNTVIDAANDATKWSSFPALTWPAGVNVLANNRNTILSLVNQQFSGGTASPSPHPQGWLSGGDSMGWRSASIIGLAGQECYFDSGNNAQWTDWDYPTPTYPAGQNTISTARVWVASANGHSDTGATFIMQMYPEAASVSSHTFSTTITGATNATPIVVTATAHALRAGQRVSISGVGGNTAANGTYYAGSITANTFALYSDPAQTTAVAGNGAYTSGGTVACTAPTAYTDLVIATSGATSTITSAAHPFVNGDANKIITIFGGTGFTLGNYTITGVSSGTATVNGNIGTATSTGGIGILALDSGGNAGNNNFTLENPADGLSGHSGIVGAQQVSSAPKLTSNNLRYKNVFSWSGLSQDFDILKYRLYGPNVNDTAGVNYPGLEVVDVRLIPTNLNGAIHLAANNNAGAGAYCLGGVWIKRDYTGTTTTYTDLAISGANTSKVTSAAHPFQTAQVGQVLVITGGTNWTTGNYVITAVDGSHVATLSAAAATSGTATSGAGTAYNVQDYSKSNIIAVRYSAPVTTPLGTIQWRFGFQRAGQPITSIVWSNIASYSSDGTYFYCDISEVDLVDANARAQTAYLYLKIESDLDPGIAPADLCTIGPISNAGNFSVGLTDYNYVGVEAQDNSLDISGASTGNTTDGTVLSDSGGASIPNLTPSNYQAQASITFPAFVNAAANFLYVYRFGGALAGTNVTTYTSYILIAKCPRWSGGTNGATGWTWSASTSLWTSTDGYRTWDPVKLTLTDDTPDLSLIGNDFLVNGRGAPPTGATSLDIWNNRVTLAVKSTLYISWLLVSDVAAGLYYNPTIDTEDPYAAIKGGVYPVEANDNDSIVRIKTHGQYLDIMKQKSVHLLTGLDPVSGFQLTPHLRDAGIGLVGGLNALCSYDSKVAFVGPTAVHEYRADPARSLIGDTEASEQAPILSQNIEPLLAPFLKGGTAISATAYQKCVLHYHGRRLWLFAPVAGGSSNSVAYVYDTRPSMDGSGPTGWVKFTNMNIVSACSLSGQNDTDDLYLGGDDGQIYKVAGNGDVSSLVAVTGATNATPIIITAASHGFTNGDKVLVTGVGGNTAANGNWFVGSAATNTFALYQDLGLTTPVAGSGGYTSGGAAGKISAISWSVTSRGLMNESNDFRYFKTNRPTRAYFLLSTSENASVTFSASVVGIVPTFSVVYPINGAQKDIRFKVGSEIRGYGAVVLTVAGATRSQSRITAIGCEDAKGAVRGNV